MRSPGRKTVLPDAALAGDASAAVPGVGIRPAPDIVPDTVPAVALDPCPMPRSGPCPVRNRDFITRIIVFLLYFFTFVFMKIIADSGSTKCTWLLIDGVHTREVRTRGINAVQHSPEQIREALAELPPCGAAEAVYFTAQGADVRFPTRRRRWSGRCPNVSVRSMSKPNRTCWALRGPCSAGRRSGLHPRHGFQFVLVPRRRNRGKRTAAGLRSRRRGQRQRYWGATSLTVSSRGIFPWRTSFSRRTD